MRYALLIVLGLAIGIIGTVMTMQALHSGPNYPHAEMAMINFQMESLEANSKNNRCAVSDNLPYLQTMRALANDIEPVFLPIDNEKDFRENASNLRASLDAALAAPPADCPAVLATMKKIGHECGACHKEFKS